MRGEGDLGGCRDEGVGVGMDGRDEAWGRGGVGARGGVVVRPAWRACALGGRVDTLVFTRLVPSHACSARLGEQSLGLG